MNTKYQVEVLNGHLLYMQHLFQKQLFLKRKGDVKNSCVFDDTKLILTDDILLTEDTKVEKKYLVNFGY